MAVMPPIHVTVTVIPTATGSQSSSGGDWQVSPEGADMWSGLMKKSVDVEVKKIDFEIMLRYFREGLPDKKIASFYRIYHIGSALPLSYFADEIDPPLSKWMVVGNDMVPIFSMTDYDLQRLDVVRLRQLFIARREYEQKEVINVIDRNEAKGFTFLRPMRSDEYAKYHAKAIDGIRERYRKTGKL